MATAPLATRPLGTGLDRRAARILAARHGLILAGALTAVAAWLLVMRTGYAMDAHAYWLARPPHLYGRLVDTVDAYLYSPVFAQLLVPLTALPWHVFLALWLGAMLLTLGWLTGPVLLAPVLLLVFPEFISANIHLFMAAAVVLGFRHPWTWALILLTKVTPGVGLLWFAVRREWRSLAVALGATAVIAGVSFALDPAQWWAWLEQLRANTSARVGSVLVPFPLWLRLLAAAGIVSWGARTDRPWTVPVAVTLGLPHVWTIGYTVLFAIVPLVLADRRWSTARGRAATRV